jgi:hypothetical protein
MLGVTLVMREPMLARRRPSEHRLWLDAQPLSPTTSRERQRAHLVMRRSSGEGG